MIIIIEPEKDLYVTNINTKDNIGIDANTGKASTIDLFKLYNENKYSNSWAIFQFNGQAIQDEQTLTLKDANGVTKIFEFDSNGTTSGSNIAIVGSNGSNEAVKIKNAIDAVSDFKISAHVNSNNEILLKQEKPGESGDTEFTLPTGMSHKYSLSSFARIDYSAGLLKFDLNSFKNKWITLDSSDDLQGAFENLTAEIVLKDVTTGITKPKNYTVDVFKMLKNFDEGIGKDTIFFSDKQEANFKSLDNQNTTWAIPGFISSLDATQLSTSSNIELGNENIVLNITEYFKEQIKLSTLTDKGFLVKISDSFLYNTKSYFAKRLGSRHLLNKKLIPELRIKINDASYHIPKNSFKKQRLFNNNEKFYLFNNVNGSLSNFISPTGLSTLKLKITNKDDTVDIVSAVNASSNITNFKGNAINGVYTATINVDKFNSTIASLIKNEKLEANYVWFWSNADGSSTKSLLVERVDFHKSETHKDIDFENLISVVKVDENFINSNDSVSSLKVYFLDTKKEFDVVKVPYSLPSENLGDVKYRVYDVESGKTILDYDDNATLMFFDGEKYVFDLFVPKSFKDIRINFEFKYIDPSTQNEKFIFNKKYSTRIL